MRDPIPSESDERDYDTRQVDYLLPEWIEKLKQYFERGRNNEYITKDQL